MDLSSTPNPTVHDVPKILFSYLDYTIFVIMLGTSALIGIYFGFCGSKQNTTDEYLLGGKNMRMLPVALSLIASQVSGISLMVVPADVYKYGSNYWWVCITIILMGLINSYVYLPIFFKLQQTSVFEYLNLRFNKKIRSLASFIYALSIIIYNPIVVYVPAVAFAQVTGISVHLIALLVSIICIFYTAIGGLKAVVWTDAFQFVTILLSAMVIFFVGASYAGGFSSVWEKAVEGHRLDFNFAFDPTVRDGFWHLVFGSISHWISIFVLNPGYVQKSLAVSTFKQARNAQVVFVFGMAVLVSLLVFSGNIMYANYSGCDPLLSKQVSRNDQLLPHFVMELAEGIPGLPGIFIAGIFSASLSTLSASLNTISATIYEDFVSPFISNISQKQASNILKLIVVAAGAISTALVFVVERVGGLFGFTVAMQGITAGSMFGLFTLGALFPNANATGALYGTICGLLFSSWIICANQWYSSQGLLEDFARPVSVENCSFLNLTAPVANSTFSFKGEPFVLYRISFWYSTLMGGTVVIIVGLIVSWFTRKDDPPVHPDLISPVVKVLSARRGRSMESPPAYLSVDNALHLVTLNANT